MDTSPEGPDSTRTSLAVAESPRDQTYSRELQKRLKEIEEARSALDAANRQMQAVLDAAT